MNLLKRLSNLWKVSQMDSRYFDIVGGNIPGEPEIIWPLDLAKKQRAEFLRPNRAEIILKEKENPSIDDVLEHE